MEDERRLLSGEDTDKKILNGQSADSDSLIEGVSVSDECEGVLLERKDQISLESLLYDGEEGTNNDKILADVASYEAGLSEYHDLMHRAMTISPVGEDGSDAEGMDEKAEKEAEAEADESEFLISLPKNKPAKSHYNTGKGGHEEISLIPGEYEDYEPDSVFVSEEALPDTADVDSGKEMLGVEEPTIEEDEDFQLSFSFDEERRVPKKEEDSERDNGDNPQRMRIVDYAFEFVEVLTFTLLVVIICTSFLFNHSVVEGKSMLPTLTNGDHLIISDLFYTPQRGDIVVFEDYSTVLKKAVIKRVVGLPGDIVEIKAEGESYVIYVNGGTVEKYERKGASYDEYHTGRWEVAEGELFVLGDNHYDSTDSRHTGVGTISDDSVLGKVLFRFYPFGKTGKID